MGTVCVSVTTRHSCADHCCTFQYSKYSKTTIYRRIKTRHYYTLDISNAIVENYIYKVARKKEDNHIFVNNESFYCQSMLSSAGIDCDKYF